MYGKTFQFKAMCCWSTLWFQLNWLVQSWRIIIILGTLTLGHSPKYYLPIYGMNYFGIFSPTKILYGTESAMWAFDYLWDYSFYKFYFSSTFTFCAYRVGVIRNSLWRRVTHQLTCPFSHLPEPWETLNCSNLTTSVDTRQQTTNIAA